MQMHRQHQDNVRVICYLDATTIGKTINFTIYDDHRLETLSSETAMSLILPKNDPFLDISFPSLFKDYPRFELISKDFIGQATVDNSTIRLPMGSQPSARLIMHSWDHRQSSEYLIIFDKQGSVYTFLRSF
jgi:hypothetical protein